MNPVSAEVSDKNRDSSRGGNSAKSGMNEFDRKNIIRGGGSSSENVGHSSYALGRHNPITKPQESEPTVKGEDLVYMPLDLNKRQKKRKGDVSVAESLEGGRVESFGGDRTIRGPPTKNKYNDGQRDGVLGTVTGSGTGGRVAEEQAREAAGVAKNSYPVSACILSAHLCGFKL